ncbi:outer membrane protein assembly factor BamC [Echinimonas agarilytica]|uniref:Outer membrane protein assembly factor BamC n=1 Tax=Echinimonas agarilytica TaxID=1215918 RepID=A0AA42B769_9GAMM|nr:outer membrane protein assembly factor BamC [Echinimonas agarilytica]MCM2679286.1 outer membrane protein assembly factor BamC [Echinimonas agarilytica]
MVVKKALICAIPAAFVLVGCAGNDDRARSDYKYLEEQQSTPLMVPDGMEMPLQRSEYAIPKVKDNPENVVGEDLVITAPVQVLTLVDGSIRPQDGRRASIEFDVLDQNGADQSDQVWESLWNYLRNNQIQGRFWDKEGGTLVTDWFVADSQADPAYFWGLEDYFMDRRGDLEVKARYVFNLELSKSGRTAKLSAAMVGFERYLDSDLERSTPTSVERDNFTVNFLNGAVFQYQKDVAYQQRERVKQERRALALSLQTDEKGNTSVIAAVPFEQAWDHMFDVLTQAGFVVEDRDKNQATYFVNVPGSWSFSNLFSTDDGVLELESGDYKLFFGDRGKTTSISIFDDDNKPLSSKKVTKAYNALKASLDAAEK